MNPLPQTLTNTPHSIGQFEKEELVFLGCGELVRVQQNTLRHSLLVFAVTEPTSYLPEKWVPSPKFFREDIRSQENLVGPLTGDF